MVDSITSDQLYTLQQISDSNLSVSDTASLLSASFSSILSSTIGDADAEFISDDSSDSTSSLLSDSGLSTDLMLSLISSGADTSSMIQLLSSMSGLSSLSGLTDSSSVYEAYNNSILQTIQSANSSSSAKYETASYQAAYPSAASVATNPLVTSDESNRSAALYNAVVSQFDVEDSPRYEVNKKGYNDTYCNIFVWDVTSAMDAEIPHYVDPETQEAVSYEDREGAQELTANGIYKWLENKGEEYGWTEVTAEEAQALANEGYPVVTTKYNSEGHGHTQVVVPSADGEYDADRGVAIAQAGSTLTEYSYMSELYSQSGIEEFKYYAHN